MVRVVQYVEEGAEFERSGLKNGMGKKLIPEECGYAGFPDSEKSKKTKEIDDLARRKSAIGEKQEARSLRGD